MLWSDLVTDALIEIEAYAPGDTIDASVLTVAERWCNRLVDQWAALKRYAYNVNFTAYTLHPNLNPHTIGPSGATFTAARPIRIESAAIILNTSTPNVDQPITIRDDAWWADQRVKSLTSTLPTDLYYSPDYPNGSLYFWPIPTVAYGVRLEMWNSISTISNFATNFAAPPGYEQALTLSLAEKISRPLGRPIRADLAADAATARRALFSNNVASPRIASADYSQPGSGRRADFNWISSQPA